MPVRKKKISPRTSRSLGASPSTTDAGAKLALAAIAAAMKRLDAKWYLFGAQAVALHGAQRTTQDIDVTVLVDRPTAAVIAALEKQGIVPRFSDREFVEQTRVIPCDHPSTGWKIDVVLGGPGLEELFAAEAEARTVGGITVPLVRIEHLVAMKVFAGRPQDLGDVTRLLSLKRPVDLDAVRQLLAALEEGLSESGLLDRLERLTRPG